MPETALERILLRLGQEGSGSGGRKWCRTLQYQDVGQGVIGLVALWVGAQTSSEKLVCTWPK